MCILSESACSLLLGVFIFGFVSGNERCSVLCVVAIVVLGCGSFKKVQMLPLVLRPCLLGRGRLVLQRISLGRIGLPGI